MSTVDKRLAELGVTLPVAAKPVANYVPFVLAGRTLVVSGQIALGPDGKLDPSHVGKLGAGVSDEVGRAAARLCAINVLSQAKAALGDLDRIARCIRLGGFIHAAPDYYAVAGIMNGASDLMVDVLGDKGRHARSTVGVAALPFGSAVEVEALFDVEG